MNETNHVWRETRCPACNALLFQYTCDDRRENAKMHIVCQGIRIRVDEELEDLYEIRCPPCGNVFVASVPGLAGFPPDTFKAVEE